ncbi:MAG: hypothetical protein GQ574_22745 [Crocinitomix sp.]|nr:hypothetical protein [Crocinitomix sp.]
MEDVTKNMTDLFDLAKNAPVDYPISNITSVIGGAAATGAVGGATSFFKLSNIIIMLGTIITAVTVLVMVNPTGSNANTVENIPAFSKHENVAVEKSVLGLPENDIIEENELKSVLPIDQDSSEPIVQEIIIVENIIDTEPAVISPENTLAAPGNHVDPFHSVHLNISANVIIVKGDQPKITFDNNDELAGLFEMTVDNKILRINIKEGKQREFNKHVNNHDVNIYLTMSEVKSLVINGSGDIYSADDIPSDALDIQINGSGDVRLDKILPEKFEISVNGSGDVSLYGEGDITAGEININGSGDVCTRSIDVSKMAINIIGSGDVRVTCNEMLEVTILGSGDVCYSGNAEVVVQEFGSGDVENCD